MAMKIDKKGLDYHVEISGEGFPVVFLHGFTGDTSTWSAVENFLSEDYKLVKIDLVGHGKTSSPDSVQVYEMSSVIGDLCDILRELKIEKVDLVGYSMGGRVALAFALTYPDFVRRLVLESASPGLASEEERKARREQDQKLANQIQEYGLEWFIDYWENISLFESQKKLPSSIRKRIKEQRKQNSIKGLSNSLLGMGTGSQPSYWESLRLYNGPVLLVTGSIDKKFVSIAEKMSQRLNNCRWINIDGCGHAIHVEEPEKFGTIVSGFLSNETYS